MNTSKSPKFNTVAKGTSFQLVDHQVVYLQPSTWKAIGLPANGQAQVVIECRQ